MKSASLATTYPELTTWRGSAILSIQYSAYDLRSRYFCTLGETLDMLRLSAIGQISWLAAASCLFASNANAAPPRICETKEQAIAVAKDILSYVYLEFQPEHQAWKPIAELEDLKTWQYWIIEYGPSGSTTLGGGPKIALSKPDCHVLEIRETE